MARLSLRDFLIVFVSFASSYTLLILLFVEGSTNQLSLETQQQKPLLHKTEENQHAHHYKNDNVFYSCGGWGRSGTAISQMLLDSAIASYHNWTFMGTCFSSDYCWKNVHSYQPSFIQAHQVLVKDMGLEQVLRFACPTEMEKKNVLFFGRGHDYKSTPHVNVSAGNARPPFTEAIQQYATMKWLSHVRSQVQQHVSNSSDNNNTIAIHIRRGDLRPCRKDGNASKTTLAQRYYPNRYYLDLIERYRTDDDIKVTIYSEADSFEPWDEFVTRNYTLKLDTDLTEVWKGILSANLIILSASVFGVVPAIFSSGTVVYTPFRFSQKTMRANPLLRTWKKAPLSLIKRSDREVTRMQKKCGTKQTEQTKKQNEREQPQHKSTVHESSIPITAENQNETEKELPQDKPTVQESSVPITAENQNEEEKKQAEHQPTVHASSVPITAESVFYSCGRWDRSGTAISHMLVDSAIAWYYNLTYMGACFSNEYCYQTARYYQPMKSYKPAFIEAHKKLVKDVGLDQVLLFACPNNATQQENVLFFGHGHDYNVTPHVNISADNARPPITQAMQQHFVPEWLNRVKSQLQHDNDDNDNNKVAVHVRRGDLRPCLRETESVSPLASRYYPNSYYASLVNRYANENATVTIYSEEDSFEPWNVFREKNYTLRLDTELAEVWKGIMNANVVILSASVFGMVPAIFSRGQVVHTPFRHSEKSLNATPPIETWKKAPMFLIEQSAREVKKMQEQQCSNGTSTREN